MREADFQSAEAPAVKAEAPVHDGQPSFEFLIQAHQPKLYNFIYRYTRNRQDAEDLMQDTFVKAFRHFDRYDRRYAFSTWLYTIARRTLYNHHRGKRPMETIEFELVDEATSPAIRTELSDSHQTIWALVKTLRPDYQEVLILKYAEDLSVKEISQVMNRSVVLIKTLLFRARQQLLKIDQHNLLSL